MSFLGKLVVKIVGDSAELNKSIDDSGKSLDKLEDNTKKTSSVLSSLLVPALIAAGTAAIKLASDAEEQGAKFNAVFKNQADEVREWSKQFSDSVNRSSQENIAFLATIQDTLVPLGFMREKATEMSKATIELATDLASFNNLPTEQVIRDIQSALVGNTETLRKYGVVANQSAIIQEAINDGLIDSASELDATSKAQAIYNLIIKGTTDAQGDAIRTADSFANQFRGLQATIQDIGVEFGSTLLPLLSDLIKIIKPLLISVGELVTSLSKSLGPALEITIEIIGGVIDVVIWLTDATANLTGGFKSIGEAARESGEIMTAALEKGISDGESFDEVLNKVANTTGLTKEEVLEIAKTTETIRDIAIEWEEAQKKINERALESLEILAQETELRIAAIKALPGIYGDFIEGVFQKLDETNDAIDEFTLSLGENNDELDDSIKTSKSYKDQLTELERGFESLKRPIEEATEAEEEFGEAGRRQTEAKREQLAQQLADYEIFLEEYENAAKESAERLIEIASNTTAMLLSSLGGLFTAITDRRIAELDRQLQAELAAAGLSEETEIESLQEKLDAAIEAGDDETAEKLEDDIERLRIQEEFEKKKAELVYKGQLQAWGFKLAEAIATAPVAIINALNTGYGAGFPAGIVLGPLLASLAGTATAIQIAAIAAGKPQPPQFEDGALVLPTPGGITGVIGEGDSPEAILPLRDDVMSRIANSITANMQPQSNIFQTTNTFPDEMTLLVEGVPMRAFITDSIRNGQIQVAQRGITAR